LSDDVVEVVGRAVVGADVAAEAGRVGVDADDRRGVVVGDGLVPERAPLVDVGLLVDVELLVVVASAGVDAGSEVVVAARTKRGPVPDRSRVPASTAPHPAARPTARAMVHPLRLEV
jgi:hypothetical protein